MEKTRPNIINNVKRLYLIGFPVGHSASPHIYNSVFKSCSINARYEGLEVRSEDLANIIEALRNKMCKGFNVTAPHKVKVMEYLDRLEHPSTIIGAVNTVVNDEDKLIGYNTDWIGFKKALERFTSKSSIRKVLILGAGGAARAVIYALKDIAEELSIVSLSGTSAVKLAKEVKNWGLLETRGFKTDPTILMCESSNVDLIVNATPLGCRPRTWKTPIPKECLRGGVVVFDLVYNPLKTRLLREAEEVGCKTIDGLWMLVYQAVENLKLWFNLDVNVEELRKYGLEAIKGMGE